MNVDTDTQYAFTRPVVEHMFKNYDGVLKIDGEVGNKKAYDPRAWGKRPRPVWPPGSSRPARPCDPRAPPSTDHLPLHAPAATLRGARCTAVTLRGLLCVGGDVRGLRTSPSDRDVGGRRRGEVHDGCGVGAEVGAQRGGCAQRHDVGMTHPNLLGGTPPTLLPDDAGPRQALEAGADPADVAAAHPAASLPWAALAERALDAGRTIEGYAYARVGYHRGLDALRKAGWRGQGPVPWSHRPNRGFLRALSSLGRAAGLIGEDAEQQRVRALLTDCDPEAADELGSGAGASA